MSERETSRSRAHASQLVGVAIAGQGVGYLLSVLLARRLSLEGFEAYLVASAAFILLATFAARGSEKYALLRFPALLRREDWGMAHGLLAFGVRRTLFTALAAATALSVWNWWAREPGDAVRAALFATGASLPAGALMHYGVEVLSAAGRPLRALTIFKFFVPATALSLVLLLLVAPMTITAAIAIGCWGVGWLVALVATGMALRRALPRALIRTPALYDRPRWRAESSPFFVYRLALALLGQTGVIALDLLQGSPVAVGAFGAAAATVGLAAVLATSTNRAYGRDLSMLLDTGDFDGLLAARRARLRWLLPAVLVFLILTFAFSRQILAPYGAALAESGAWPLRLLACSTAFGTIFALAPTYLKARRRNRGTYAIVAFAALGQLALLILLVPALGATGAALACATSMSAMYGMFALTAWRDLAALRARHSTKRSST